MAADQVWHIKLGHVVCQDSPWSGNRGQSCPEPRARSDDPSTRLTSRSSKSRTAPQTSRAGTETIFDP